MSINHAEWSVRGVAAVAMLVAVGVCWGNWTAAATSVMAVLLAMFAVLYELRGWRIRVLGEKLAAAQKTSAV